MTLPADAIDQALADKDGRRLAARLFGELGLSEGALMIPRREAELAVVMAIQVGLDLGRAHEMGDRHCRVCACTEFVPCRGPDGPCAWVEGDPTLCTACAPYPEPA